MVQRFRKIRLDPLTCEILPLGYKRPRRRPGPACGPFDDNRGKLYEHIKTEGACTCTDRMLAESLGFCVQTITGYLKSMRSDGLVSVVRRRYRLNLGWVNSRTMVVLPDDYGYFSPRLGVK